MLDIVHSRDITTQKNLCHKLENDTTLFDGIYWSKADEDNKSRASHPVLLDSSSINDLDASCNLRYICVQCFV